MHKNALFSLKKLQKSPRRLGSLSTLLHHWIT